MKNIFLKLKYLLLFELFCVNYLAQTKDTLVPKTVEIKEDVNVVKKRKYIYSVSNRFNDDEKYDVFKFTPSFQKVLLKRFIISFLK